MCCGYSKEQSRLKNKYFSCSKLPGDVFVMIIRVKMPTIVGILTFVSMIDVVLGWVERGKGFITSGFVWVNKSIVSRK